MFKDILNNYLEKLNCNSKELSIKSGLSQAVISRYKNGTRIPNIDSEQLNKLINSLYNISIEKNINLKKEDILNSFINTIKKDDFDYISFSEKFDKIINELKISIIDMSRYIKFDASYISRIRTGQRKPAYPDEFIDKVCNYIVNKYNNSNAINDISSLLECDPKVLENDYHNKLRLWLTNNLNSNKNTITGFLKHLDNFNLNDYIKTIKFDELKIPSIPFYKAKNRNYYGIDEMKSGELNFFKATVLSKSDDQIFMCSDMPMEDMAKDIQFGKKWMFAIAMCLKKGLHLNIIHNLDRPFNEMMLGLESWIPIYMTGQISPYYLKDNKDNVYNHFNYVSGAVALTGEAIKGYHNKGKYYLTNNKKELEYFKTKAECLFKKANPLMEIYKDESFNHFLNEYSLMIGNRRRILSSLPLFTINDELLISILKRNKICNNDIKKIIQYKNNELKIIENILNNNIIHDEIPNDCTSIALENIFYDKEIFYTKEEIKKHLDCTKQFCKNHSNYHFDINKQKVFNNITITIVENNCVIISKKTNPIIHFVIKHPKLRNSIENFKFNIKE